MANFNNYWSTPFRRGLAPEPTGTSTTSDDDYTLGDAGQRAYDYATTPSQSSPALSTQQRYGTGSVEGGQRSQYPSSGPSSAGNQALDEIRPPVTGAGSQRSTSYVYGREQSPPIAAPGARSFGAHVSPPTPVRPPALPRPVDKMDYLGGSTAPISPRDVKPLPMHHHTPVDKPRRGDISLQNAADSSSLIDFLDSHYESQTADPTTLIDFLEKMDSGTGGPAVRPKGFIPPASGKLWNGIRREFE